MIFIVGTNEDAIIHVVTTRNNDQRQQIEKKYKAQYGRVCFYFRLSTSDIKGRTLDICFCGLGGRGGV